MKTWLRGKSGGLIAFLAIAALVMGGLGWVTATVLQLEQEQLVARADAEYSTRLRQAEVEHAAKLRQAEVEHAAKLRQALWQLDSVMMAKLSHEASRPFSHFSALNAISPLDPGLNRCEPGLEVSPLINADLPDWILLHFSTSPDADWWSPQAPSSRLQDKLKNIVKVTPEEIRRKAALLDELKTNLRAKTVLAAVRHEEQRQEAIIRVQLFDEAAVAKTGKDAWNSPTMGQQNFSEYQSRVGRFGYGQEPATHPKLQKNSNVLTQIGPVSPNNEHWLKPGLREKSREEIVTPGPWTALWIKTQNKRLILARQVTIGKQQVCQGILLNWDTLRDQLTAEVKDLFPQAKLQPVRLDIPAADKSFPPRPERTMAALPVELDPGTQPAMGPLPAMDPRLPLDDPGWTPLRIGLALAWAAALVALAAVGLGGWSLIDLSQRRIRFVSTVTHELRTPLTTLRLYLDMLTGGMVRDEKQKEEYLHTLNNETDRLNRLVGNVLDFSRLENQRPRLEPSTVKAADLLDQVRATWETRCKDADKELIVESTPELALVTDVKLVQQLLGNLIDNACKYSRSAADRRLWLRARAEGKIVVLEVEDRGPGVPRKERRSIFRPFRRGQDAEVTAGGVGLGLALSVRWAGLLGGRLTVQPGQDNQGACFRLELPV